jgi:putative intracellular protease/amidase
MRIAFVIYPGMTALDFVGVYDPLTRLKTMELREDITWEVCALTQLVNEIAGLTLLPSLVGTPLTGFDLLVVPGGFVARELAEDQRSSPGCAPLWIHHWSPQFVPDRCCWVRQDF